MCKPVKRPQCGHEFTPEIWQEKFQKGFFEEIDGAKMQCCIIDGYCAFAFNNELDIQCLQRMKRRNSHCKAVYAVSLTAY